MKKKKNQKAKENQQSRKFYFKIVLRKIKIFIRKVIRKINLSVVIIIINNVKIK